MQRHLTPRALGRAQWFSELLTALGEAERLLALLDADGGFPIEAAKLKQRVEAVASEIELLNKVVLGEGRIVSGRWPEPMHFGAAQP